MRHSFTPCLEMLEDRLAMSASMLGGADLLPVAAPEEGVAQHELGHTLGFRHEHTRPDATEPREGVCHGVTVLAGARVDGVSPGWGSSMYQYAYSGTSALDPDDVVVDGRIITGENFDASLPSLTDSDGSTEDHSSHGTGGGGGAGKVSMRDFWF